MSTLVLWLLREILDLHLHYYVKCQHDFPPYIFQAGLTIEYGWCFSKITGGIITFVTDLDEDFVAENFNAALMAQLTFGLGYHANAEN